MTDIKAQARSHAGALPKAIRPARVKLRNAHMTEKSTRPLGDQPVPQVYRTQYAFPSGMTVHVRTEFGIEQNNFAPVTAVRGMSGMPERVVGREIAIRDDP